MTKRLKLYFEATIAALSVVGVFALVFWFFGGLYMLNHPVPADYYNQGPQDPVDTH